jgi:glycosyltransferase involved in cell wall biosynthesis
VGQVPAVTADGITVHGVLALGDPRGRQQIERLLRDATCLVMPSRHEPSALAYVEAAHAGLPSIVSKAGGSEELVGPGGIGVDPDDARALLDAMTALSDPTLARATGAKAQVHAQLYTWDAVAERLLRALRPDQAVQRNLARFL